MGQRNSAERLPDCRRRKPDKTTHNRFLEFDRVGIGHHQITTHLCWTTLILLICMTVGAPAAWGQEKGKPAKDKKAPPSDISRGTLRVLDKQVIPAVQANESDAFMAAISKIIERSTPTQLDAIERYGKSEGVGSIRSLFSNEILKKVEQGTLDSGNKLNRSIALYISDELIKRVHDGLNQLKAHPVMADPLQVPDNWKDSEQLFWEIHVYKNEFLNAERLAKFGIQVLTPHLKSIEKSGEADQLAIIKRMDQLGGQLQDAFRQMLEREAEMHLMRFNESSQKLHAPGDFETHLTAAMCMEIDAEKLVSFFGQFGEGVYQRPALNAANLPATIQTMVKKGREVGDDISLKAILLRSGMHFWLRGRYGEGPLAWGLLKSPEAMKSKYHMEGLYMPKMRPQPISMYHNNESSQPGYDRRHFYTWAVEYRPLIKTAGYNNKSDYLGSQVESARATGDTFW